jgi:RNA polymerase sigma-70 factor, ECF subfamily
MSKLLLAEGDKWVEQARNGNQDAFNKLMEAYYSRVWRASCSNG